MTGRPYVWMHELVISKLCGDGPICTNIEHLELDHFFLTCSVIKRLAYGTHFRDLVPSVNDSIAEANSGSHRFVLLWSSRSARSHQMAHEKLIGFAVYYAQWWRQPPTDHGHFWACVSRNRALTHRVKCAKSTIFQGWCRQTWLRTVCNALLSLSFSSRLN